MRIDNPKTPQNTPKINPNYSKKMNENQSTKTNTEEGLDTACYYSGLKGRLLKKWDWWVYRRAHNSLRRMYENEPAYGYLLELSIKEWNSRQPLSDSTKKSAESFHQSFTK